MEIKSGIKLLAENEGAGPVVKKGDRIRVRLNGWLTKGECIQENFIGEYVFGSRKCGQLISGIAYSIAGMRQGGKRKVRISPHLAYRDVGVKDRIPPSAVLIYEIELLEIAPNPPRS
jgi:FKBP-type peptidyl-prolyl cis-trans isomerase